MATEPSSRRFYRFGGFQLDALSGELYRDGQPVRLPPKPAKLLLRLVTARGQLVTREELETTLWGDDTFVDFEQGIRKAITQIRAALEDDAEKPTYVETVSRRGYRFLLDTGPDDSEASARDRDRCPYPGLSAFTQEDTGFFFGREEEVESLWKKLESRRLLALIGPSGAGKSSLLRAGLIPTLPEGWDVVLCQPRNGPFVSLAASLGVDASSDLMKGLTARRGNHAEVLLVVDQFEELFTQNDQETQARFSVLLGRAASSGVHVLLSMRDDFLIHCHDHRELDDIFKDLTPLKPPRGPALRRALTEPARICGYRFEDEALVADILAAVTNERGALPLLGFAASRLWEKRDRARNLLTREAYFEIGGVGGALAQHAEAVLTEIGSAKETFVREIFRNLTTAKGTRASQNKSELRSVFEDREASSAVLQKLIQARLLTSFDSGSGDEVELVHETLLASWPRLVRWQAQDAEGAILRDQLRQAAQAWHERSRPEDLLWTGTSLRELTLWRERYPGRLTATQQAFVEASAELAGRTRRRRRIALVAAMATSIAVALVTASLWRQARAEARRAEASKLLAIAELRLQEDPTEALAFATASLEEAETREARTFLMKAAWEAPPAFELNAGTGAARAPAFSPDGKWLAAAGHATDALVWSQEGAGPIVLPGHDTSPRGPNFARWASNDLLATGLCCTLANRVNLWSLPGVNRLRTIDFGGPSSWQVGPVGLLAARLESGSRFGPGAELLRQWSLPGGEPEFLGRVDRMKLGANWTIFGPDGRSLLYGKGGKLYLRPLPVGSGSDRLLAPIEGGVEDFAVSNSRNRLVIAGGSGATYVWSFPSEGVVHEKTIPRPDTAQHGMLLDPSGRWLINGNPDADQQIRIWNVTAWTAARPLALRRGASWYASNFEFDPSGAWVVASTDDFNRLTFWPLTRTYPSVVDGYAGTLFRPVTFSPDGKWLATSWAGTKVRLWPLPGSGETVRWLQVPEPAETDPLTSLAFDPNGRYLFASANEGRAWILPLDGSAPRRFPSFSEDTLLYVAAISPSGRLVATAFGYGQSDKTIAVWNLETGELQRFDLPKGHESETGASETATGYERGILSMAFADESTLYTVGDGGLRRWDVKSGSSTLVAETSAEYWRMSGAISAERGVALTFDATQRQSKQCSLALVHDLSAGTSRELVKFGDCVTRDSLALALDRSGTVAALGSDDGIVRVGLLSGGEPHLLVGHKGVIDRIAISPDLRWVATTGGDNTLRLWPMPDLSKPPLHSLPHDELLAKLRSLTNFRAVRDSLSATGWKVEVGPFPGWKNVPVW